MRDRVEGRQAVIVRRTSGGEVAVSGYRGDKGAGLSFLVVVVF